MAGGALLNFLTSNFDHDVGKHRNSLEQVRDALLRAGERDAAAATDRVLAQIDKARVGGADLQNVWQEVERMLAGDGNVATVLLACVRWRASTRALDADLRGTFLKLWSKAVGTEGYARREWAAVQERLDDAARYGRREEATQPDADKNRRR